MSPFPEQLGRFTEALRKALQEDDPDRAVDALLSQLGEMLQSERAYIFERNPRGSYDNTYEWCADGVTRQQSTLQNVPSQVVGPWLERFARGETVVLHDVEFIRERSPGTYAYLAPQGIRSLVVSPLTDQGELVGFFGVDDPPRGSIDHIPPVLDIAGSFVVCLLRRRDLVHRLEYLSLHDHLTGAGNRHALQRYFDSLNPLGSLGVVYADVTGLKRLNDTQGHRAGDELLIRASRCLARVFPAYPVFRVGGDEFLVLCPNITEGALLERENRLRDAALGDRVVLASGCAWYGAVVGDMEQLTAQAEQRMYEAKRAYYQDAAHDRRRRDR